MTLPQAHSVLDREMNDRKVDPRIPAAARISRATWRVDVSDVVPLSGTFEIAVDVISLAQHPKHAAPVVLACLPGGYLSRKYYDLEGPGGSPAYSFAEAMAHAGFVTLAFDHLGVGESSRPGTIEDGYALGVEEIARANQRALELSLDRLATGDSSAAIPATRDPICYGVGHSMGSVLTVEQQAQSSIHRGLILFSFTTNGVPRFLNPAQRAVANDPERARASLAKLTRETMGSPYPARASNSEADRNAAFGVGTAPASAEESLHRASTNLLGMAGLLAMIPGGYAPAAEKIEVPVLIALGDHDLHAEVGLAEMLPRSAGVTTFTLDDCWHCHFVANTRERLFARVIEWIEADLSGETFAGPDNRTRSEKEADHGPE